MTEKVKVRLKAKETVEYDQIVEMTRQQYEELLDKWFADQSGLELREFTETTMDIWINRDDPLDFDDHEIEDISLDEEV